MSCGPPDWCVVKWLGFGWLGFLAACSVASQPTLRAPLSVQLPAQVHSQACEDLHIQFRLSQSQTPTYQASIREQSGQLPTDIARVLFAFSSLPAPGKAMSSTTTLTAQPSGNGQYVSHAGFRMSAGHWQVEVIVRRQNGLNRQNQKEGQDSAQVVCTFPLKVG